jgi:hypothetical protein
MNLTKMDRRGFLAVLLGTAAAEAIDFERLLWIPKPIITVPAMPLPPQGTLLTNGVLKALLKYTHSSADQAFVDAANQFDKILQSQWRDARVVR